ncbi:MAG TPA: VWA domain-containing protein [Stellaceae bacterium]|nr:VWA domain-containing protein [Stellaceae bacterium]
MSDDPKGGNPVPAPGRTDAVDAFLRQVAAMPAARPTRGRGRLIFAMDATASRGPTWDRACRLQGEMFEATAGLGGLEVQLVFYRGFNECKASRWLTTAPALHRAMRAVSCVGGETQIARVLGHAASAAKAGQVGALVFVGDAMEEKLDELLGVAGELALLGVPIFFFHEGGDPTASRAFKEIARVTRGAYCPFDAGSAEQLRALLGAVAAYAVGGRRALADYGRRAGGAALLLARSLDGP